MSLFLLGVAMAAMAALFTGAYRSLAFQEETDDTVAAVRETLRFVGADIRQSSQASVADGVLTLTRLAGTSSTAMDAPFPLGDPAALPAMKNLQVSYTLDKSSGCLLRSVGPSPNATSTVTRGIESFEAEAIDIAQTEASPGPGQVERWMRVTVKARIGDRQIRAGQVFPVRRAPWTTK